MAKTKINIVELPRISADMGLLCNTFITLLIFGIVANMAGVVALELDSATSVWETFSNIISLLSGIAGLVFFYYVSKAMKDLKKGLPGLTLTLGIMFFLTGVCEIIGLANEEMEYVGFFFTFIGVIIAIILGFKLRNNFEGSLSTIGNLLIGYGISVGIALKQMLRLLEHKHDPEVLFLIILVAFIVSIICLARAVNQLDKICHGQYVRVGKVQANRATSHQATQPTSPTSTLPPSPVLSPEAQKELDNLLSLGSLTPEQYRCVRELQMGGK